MSVEIKDVSYAIGMSVAGSLLDQNLGELNPNEIAAAINDAFAGKAFRVEPEQANELIQNFIQEQNDKKFGDVKADSLSFLDQNKTKEGITTTDSGLQYEVITSGDGKMPAATDMVSVHYHGTLIDGTVFDSSVERGTPAQFGLNQVIKGWTEGLQLMPVGAKYRFYIPQELAYGANPHPGGAIQPFMALVFDVELLEILN